MTRKVMALLAVLLALPAFAQRGGSTISPVVNIMPNCTGTSGSCPANGYFCLDDNVLYRCINSVWTTVDVAAVPSGTTPPSTCSNGDLFVDTDAASGQRLYACESGTWVQQAGGGGGGGEGNVTGPASSTDNAIARYNNPAGSTPKDIQDSGCTVSDAGALACASASLTTPLPVASGGTAGATASAARSALGAAAQGANSDITSLSGLSTPLSLAQGGTAVASAADSGTIVSNGTTWQVKDIPNCTTGNQLLFDDSTNEFGCEADGAGGGGGLEASEEGTDVTASTRGRINFIGGAITAADNAGSTRIDVTLSQSPSAATSVVGTTRTLTGGTGIASIGDLSSDRTITVDSTEAGFLTSGALTCGGGTSGKAQVHTTPLQYCSNEATPTLRYAAFGDTSGNAITGDSATSFFSAGTLEVARGGTGATSIGSDTYVLFNDGGVVGGDAGMTYVKGTDTLTVGSISTYGAADNARYLELQRNTGDVPANVTNGYARLYASGTAGAEVPKWRTPTTGVLQLASVTGTETLTNKTIDAEGTGNVITFPDTSWFQAAGCNNATAGAFLDLPTANAPAVTCVAGHSNTQYATLDFDASTDESAQFTYKLPADWTGAIDVAYKWKAAATSGAVGWCLQLICVADAETDDPAFPAQGSGNCVSDTAKGTTLQTNDVSDTGVTATGCAAGELMHGRISRDANGGAVADDMTGDALLIGFEITVRRAM